MKTSNFQINFFQSGKYYANYCLDNEEVALISLVEDGVVVWVHELGTAGYTFSNMEAAGGFLRSFFLS